MAKYPDPVTKRIWARKDRYTAGGNSRKYIVVHNTANTASAVNEAKNLANNYTASSFHYVIDDGDIIQCVHDYDTAWAVGAWAGTRQLIGNNQSISIEVCNPGTQFSAASIENLRKLVLHLMEYYSIPASRVVRHWDCHTGRKHCPNYYAGANNAAWDQLHSYITGGAVKPTGGNGGVSSSHGGAPATGDLGIIPVHYSLRVLNGAWWDEVTNFGSGDNGYAGAPYTRHDYLSMRVDRGSLRYRVHTVGGGWLPWVYKGDRGDLVNGCAGISGHAIDGVQAYYTTPDGEGLRQVYYRSQTTKRSGWLKVCCDDGTSYDGFDGWAGMYGEPLDRLQACIATRNPFA